MPVFLQMLKKLILCITLFYSADSFAQEAPAFVIFWEQLSMHCGKAYAGKIVTDPVPADFQDQELRMHVLQCADSIMKIPFVVGDDRSRTWIFTLHNDGITLKHDHRHKDGSEDKITQYGGATTNTGFADMQFFPADQETADLIPHAAANVWWVAVNDSSFTYNLRRLSNNSHFSVEFDLIKPVQAPEVPWGWE